MGLSQSKIASKKLSKSSNGVTANGGAKWRWGLSTKIAKASISSVVNLVL